MRPGRPIFPILFALGAWAGGARAELRFAAPAADLGTVHGGPVVAHRFACVNAGPRPIEILEVRRGCGCLEPMVEKRRLDPGEAGGLRVQVRTLGQPDGPHTWRAVVRYRDGDQTHEVPVQVTATVENEVTVEPAVLALYVDREVRQEIRVTDRRAAPLKVTAVHAACPALTVTAEPAGGGTTRIVVVAAGDRLGPGRQDVTLSVYTDDPVYRHLEVPVTLQRGGRPTVAVTPPAARLRLSADRPVGTALLRLRPSGEQAVTIAGVEADAGLSATWAAGPGAGATLRVQADRRRPAAGRGPHAVRVQLAEPTRETLTIPVEIDE